MYILNIKEKCNFRRDLDFKSRRIKENSEKKIILEKVIFLDLHPNKTDG